MVRTDGPVRTCVGCRTTKAQRELIRVTRSGDGKVVIDDPGSRHRTPGRGVYLCPDASCIDRAVKSGLQRALRYKGALPHDLKERLMGRIDGSGSVDPARA
ncbi:MAG: YlxR family protein [Actinomycetota bacterium]